VITKFLKRINPFASKIRLRVQVEIKLFDERGDLKENRFIPKNTVTTAGKNGSADQILAAPSLAKPGWMAVGTGSPGANALGSEIGSSRVALSSKTRSNAIITMVASWNPGTGTGNITEVGVFDASSSGNMWLSATGFTTVPKTAADTLEVTWTLTYA